VKQLLVKWAFALALALVVAPVVILTRWHATAADLVAALVIMIVLAFVRAGRR